jgi:hypothetical protein
VRYTVTTRFTCDVCHDLDSSSRHRDPRDRAQNLAAIICFQTFLQKACLNKNSQSDRLFHPSKLLPPNRYVWKLLYIYMLGYEVEFGHMHVVSLISAPKYSEKQVGYTVASVLLNENHEFLRLVINSVREDIISRSEIFQCLGLSFVANVGGREFADALAGTSPHFPNPGTHCLPIQGPDTFLSQPQRTYKECYATAARGRLFARKVSNCISQIPRLFAHVILTLFFHNKSRPGVAAPFPPEPGNSGPRRVRGKTRGPSGRKGPGDPVRGHEPAHRNPITRPPRVRRYVLGLSQIPPTVCAYTTDTFLFQSQCASRKCAPS